VYFQQNGTLILWHRQDSSEAERFAAQLEKNCRLHTDLSAPQKLGHDDLLLLEPSVADRFNQGLYLPNEGQLDHRQLLDALVIEFEITKVDCHWHTEIEPSNVRQQKTYTGVIDSVEQVLRGYGRPVIHPIRLPWRPRAVRSSACMRLK